MSAKPFASNGVQEDMTSVAAVASLEYDAQLMLRVRAGESACFAELLDRHRNPVVHFVYRIVQNQAVSEELAQEVFLRVYRSRETYEPTAKFTTWLFRIATHLALNWLRDNKNAKNQASLDADFADSPTRQVATTEPNIEQGLLREAKFEEVRNAINLLPEKQRTAVFMHKYQEMEYSQIAKVLKCSESAVKSLLFRAYETLRARLAHMA